MAVNQSIGSVWRKWDLHFHTPSSFDYENKSYSNEELVNGLIENDISAVVITDHHYIDAERINDIRSIADSRLVVLPGIELRTELGGHESVHIIGIFPESLDAADIWRELDVKLELSKQKNANGDDRVYVDCQEAAKHIHDMGGLVSIHAGRRSNTLEGISNHELFKQQLKTDLLKDHIDVIEIAKPSNVSDYETIVFPKIGFSLPIILCSDNHDVDQYPDDRFTWIKADTTFNGLRQILYEPVDRVRIQSLQPESKPVYQLIDRIEINHSDFGQTVIPFNPNLNVIIGGRSTGKSLLLGTLAKLAGTDKDIKANNDEYEEYVKEISELSTLHFRQEEEAAHQIEFYPQSHINNLAAKDAEIQSLIENILSSEESHKNELEALKQMRSSFRSILNQDVTDLFNLINRTEDKRNQQKTLGNLTGIQAEYDKIETAIRDEKGKLPDQPSPEEQNRYDSLKEEVERRNTRKERIETMKPRIEKLMSLSPVRPLADELVLLEDDVIKKISTEYEVLSARIADEWRQILSSVIDELNTELVNIVSRLAEIEKMPIFKKCAAFFKSNAGLKELMTRAETEQGKLTKHQQYQKEIEASEALIADKKDSILSQHLNLLADIDDSCSRLEYCKHETEIKPFPNFLCEDFRKALGDKLHLGSEANKQLMDYKFVDNSTHKEYLRSLLVSIMEEKLTLKSSRDKQQFMLDIFSQPWFDISYDVKFQGDTLNRMSEGKRAFIVLRLLLDFSSRECPILIDQPEDDLDSRSVFRDLVSFLRRKKKERQLIIVTHDPNIVIGADAEEVIVANQNGDSTKNENDIKFQYTTGSLENDIARDEESEYILQQRSIKQHVCEILEGGDEAFKKREQRYH